MDKYALFTLLWNSVAVPVDAGGAPMVAALMAKVGPWFKLCALAYLITMMLIAAWSSEAATETRFFKAIFLAGIIYTLISTATAFDYYVTGLVHGTTEALSQVVANAFNKGVPLNADAYDVIGIRSFSLGLAVFKNLPLNPLKSVPLGIGVLIYWFLSYGAVVVMFSLALVSYVGESFLLDWAPLFIGCYFFPFARRWFDGWLSVVMTSVLVQVFSAGLAGLFIFVMGLVLNLAGTGLSGAQAGQVDGGAVVGSILMLVAAALISLIFVILAGTIVYFAIRITGGAHSALGSMQTPSWMPSLPSPSMTPASGPAPLPPSPGPSSPLAGAPPAPAFGSSQRSYSFQNPVGSAA